MKKLEKITFKEFCKIINNAKDNNLSLSTDMEYVPEYAYDPFDNSNKNMNVNNQYIISKAIMNGANTINVYLHNNKQLEYRQICVSDYSSTSLKKTIRDNGDIVVFYVDTDRCNNNYTIVISKEPLLMDETTVNRDKIRLKYTDVILNGMCGLTFCSEANNRLASIIKYNEFEVVNDELKLIEIQSDNNKKSEAIMYSPKLDKMVIVKNVGSKKQPYENIGHMVKDGRIYNFIMAYNSNKFYACGKKYPILRHSAFCTGCNLKSSNDATFSACANCGKCLTEKEYLEELNILDNK